MSGFYIKNQGLIGAAGANRFDNLQIFGGGGVGLYDFTTATFTTGGQTGRLGPSLTQARSGLTGPEVDTWKENTEFFNTSNGIQLWTVPEDGTYRIEAWGAQGGGGGEGGLGAKIQGDFQLDEGEIIRILVGQMGEENGFHGGGGGGTFAVKEPYNTNESILAIAGGGGSVSSRYGSNQQTNSDTIGRTETSGGTGFRTGSGGLGNAGANGQGGTGNDTAHGGAGFFGNGSGGSAQAFVNGGTGDSGIADGGIGVGGGAVTGWYRQGRGGGYSVGAGARGSTGSRGGGGGSFNSGTNQSNTAGENSGHGKVEITLL